ncbi:VanZ family protein [Herbiconiux sp. KACC 21604]|uniref:VanZ family protein n=1 Tax=unclassified Herbiconiux TaxID=2618217 RepID=UPI001492B398|nr:VanZ family protein [Herbiconiux sp. SALV-R1]QJU54715.1 VanZ family protein [Herbiconiux sp. SALV-R1]WPO85819.1 VanZ family protein [Herbiconiux sp. KACC 21604]
MTSFALNLLFAATLVGLAVVGLVRAGVAGASARPSRVGAPLLAVVWALAVGFMTLRPGSGLGVRLNLVPLLFDGTGSAIDAVLNLFVFVPLGVLLVAAGVRFAPTFLVALGSTLAIEITQYAMDAGRTADINDIITNTAGACLGWAVAWSVRAAASRAATPTSVVLQRP